MNQRPRSVSHDDGSHDERQRELLEQRLQYRRLVSYARAVVIKTDPSLVITSVAGNSEEILGLAPYQLVLKHLMSRQVVSSLLPSLRRAHLARKFRNHLHSRTPLSEEVELVRGESSKWLSVMVVPLYGEKESADAENGVETDSIFRGWELVVTDISSSKRIDLERQAHERRLSALYKVSQALEVNSDPRLITSRGLEALVEATASDAGYVVFKEHSTRHLDIVGSFGLEAPTIDKLQIQLQNSSLTRQVITQGVGRVIDDLDDVETPLAEILRPGLGSGIIVPLRDKDAVLGALAVFSRQRQHYAPDDFNLAAISASQVCVAARRAEFYMAERRQSKSFSALYKLSHELSKYLSPRDIALHAFPIVQEELASKRMWLGIFDEQRQYLIGEAGTGPGIRQSLSERRIPVRESAPLLRQALKSDKPIVVETAQFHRCIDLEEAAHALDLGTVILLPLHALGQAVGILVVEPLYAEGFFSQNKLPLLSSMASEIATVILARQFESRMASAEKMRVAGLLAAGIGHNFNNLLQAVIGQASLLELQLPESSPLRRATDAILQAAGKGAGLIEHLLSFSSQPHDSRSLLDGVSLLNRSREYYRSLLGPSVRFELEIDSPVAKLLGDEGLLQQVITILLKNAREAVSQEASPQVDISAVIVHLGSQEAGGTLLPGAYLQIQVRDNGRGMTSQERARCFEPFFSTWGADPATGVSSEREGLGLSTAYSMIKHHQGHLTVDSKENEGTVFTLYLPIASSLGQAQSDLVVPDRSEEVDLVVLGFDDEIEREIAGRLAAHGIRTSACHSISKAKALLRQAKDFSLVLADLDTGKIELEELFRSFSAHELRLVTFDVGRWRRVHKLKERPFKFLEKPLDVWKLHKIAREFLSVRAAETGQQDLLLAPPSEGQQGE